MRHVPPQFMDRCMNSLHEFSYEPGSTFRQLTTTTIKSAFCLLRSLVNIYNSELSRLLQRSLLLNLVLKKIQLRKSYENNIIEFSVNFNVPIVIITDAYNFKKNYT